ncbi:MAG TPA: alpha-L-fucosidase [Phycisphaerales bacterium]|nr:alpha-L-fucosidase [Phycisphaerales bacterium]HCD33399.1 alpha-L-fucosidase [Phycisphaerales bacterium]|tara:strand:+ start:2040 stop:3263 length:1224 start_codon:yes stop_codon:yes gene_type:complete
MISTRLQWFADARFGMFIHWGLYSVTGRGEWIFNRERWEMQDYTMLAEQFTAEDYDPKTWAKIARDAGMRYAVLTTKHHEGFCLWDSKTCAFNAVNSAAKRDLVGEYVTAFREAGLKVGFYYSLGDWYNEDWARGFNGDEAAYHRFMQYTRDLLTELMTQHGQIDILWYDLPQCYTALQWQAVDLNHHIRNLQPDILINNRAYTSEDFSTPEQHITAAPSGRLWESCMTLNNHWGYCPHDDNYKTASQVVLNLAQVASGGGNLLLNVGPTPQGKIPQPAIDILKQTGNWLRQNGKSIYEASDRHGLSFNLWGPVTSSCNDMYLHLKNYWGNEIIIGGLNPNVKQAFLLSTKQPLKVARRKHQTILSGLPTQSPDELITVIHLELDGKPEQDISRVIGKADIFPILTD